VQIFSLFEANPQLIDLILDIVTTAPALGQHLARNPGVLDAVLAGDFFAQWPGAPALERELGHVLARAGGAGGDYEARLDAARRWAKEWHFRIGVHFLRGLIDAREAGRQYGDLAQAVLAALWPVVVAEFSRKHGPEPGQGAVVLGMGSLGAGRLRVWEHLALTRARPVAGNMALGAEAEAFRGRLIAAKGGSARAGRILGDVGEMRVRLAAEKEGRGIFDAKLGRGHLLDIELCAQAGVAT